MAKKKQKALTQPMYYVLLSLLEERHGYEIMQYVEEFTQGRVKIGPGTLYALLARFEEEGYISMLSEKDNKKTYIIKDEGKDLLFQEIERLEQLLEDGKNIIGGGGSEV